jgi:hypothetical protein
MKRAISLCSLLLLPLLGCDSALTPTALDLAQDVSRPDADPLEAPDDYCASYCGDYTSICSNGYFTYDTLDDCEALCPYWENEDGDNEAVKCRLRALEDIDREDEAAVAQGCADAGAESALCGEAYVVTCDRYCGVFAESCPDDDAFADAAECQAYCHDTKLVDGTDTIECRLNALSSPVHPPLCASARPDSSECI